MATTAEPITVAVQLLSRRVQWLSDRDPVAVAVRIAFATPPAAGESATKQSLQQNFFLSTDSAATLAAKFFGDAPAQRLLPTDSKRVTKRKGVVPEQHDG